MKPFRLLNLPHVAFRKIAKQIDLVSLSLCSSKSRRAVQSTSNRPEEFMISHTSTNYILLNFGSEMKDGVSWNFGKLNCSDQFRHEFNIGGLIMKAKIENHENNREITFSCEDPITALHTFADFIKETFKCEVISYRLSYEEKPFYKDFIIQHVNNSRCQLLTFGDRPGKTGQIIPTIETEDIDFVIDNLRRDIKLMVFCRLPDDYKPKKPLNHQNLIIRFSRWFQREHLFSSICEHLEVYSARDIPLYDLNEYLKQWINGEHSHVLYLNIHSGRFSSIHLNPQDDIFHGIQTETFKKTRRIQNYKETNFFLFWKKPLNEFEAIWNGQSYQFWDVRAKNGAVGSVALNTNHFIFHVWRPN